jgi:hypothetical protein
VLIAVAFAALPSGVAAADAEPAPRVGEISIYVVPPNDPGHHVLELHVFPEQGVAVLKTWMSEERGVNYAIAIPRQPFEGSLDLTFPHLGRIVGKVVAAPGQEACGENGGEDANFRGKLNFRGIGGHERWSATKAYAALRDTCQPIEPPRGKGDVRLTNAVAREGPGFSGANFIAFFARSFTRLRYLEFVAVARDPDGPATFLATDVEFLPGRVAAERWIDRSVVEADRTLSVEGEPEAVRRHVRAARTVLRQGHLRPEDQEDDRHARRQAPRLDLAPCSSADGSEPHGRRAPLRAEQSSVMTPALPRRSGRGLCDFSRLFPSRSSASS